jgi:hypothetical protein
VGPQRPGAVLSRRRQPDGRLGDDAGELRGERRKLLFTGSFLGGGSFRAYDVQPDDQHFVMISGGASQSTLFGVENLFRRLAYDRGRPQTP